MGAYLLTKSELLRERFIIQRYVGTDDGYGNEVGSWVDQFSIHARVLNGGGRESVMADALTPAQHFRLVFRDSRQAQSIIGKDRAVNARTGEIFNIRSLPRPTEDRNFVVMNVEAGVAT